MRKLREFSSALWNMLDGYKTKIGVVIIFVAGGLKALNKIDEETYKLLLTFGGAVSVYGLRDAIRKLEK
jgi:hypothetical protein